MSKHAKSHTDRFGNYGGPNHCHHLNLIADLEFPFIISTRIIIILEYINRPIIISTDPNFVESSCSSMYGAFIVNIESLIITSSI